jgi:hypothetical protein
MISGNIVSLSLGMCHFDTVPFTTTPSLAKTIITKVRAMPTIDATRTIVTPSQKNGVVGVVSV